MTQKRSESGPYELWALDAAVHYGVHKGSDALILSLGVGGDLNWALVRNSELWSTVVVEHGTTPGISTIQGRLVAENDVPALLWFEPKLDELTAALDKVKSSIKRPPDSVLFLNDFLRLSDARTAVEAHPLIRGCKHHRIIDDVPDIAPRYHIPEYSVELQVVKYEQQQQKLILERSEIILSDENGETPRADKLFYAHPDSEELSFNLELKSKNGEQITLQNRYFLVQPKRDGIRLKVEASYRDDRLMVNFPGSSSREVPYPKKTQDLPTIEMEGEELKVALLIECCGSAEDGQGDNGGKSIVQVATEILGVLHTEVPSCRCCVCFYGDISHKELRGQKVTGDVMCYHKWGTPAELMGKACSKPLNQSQEGRAALEEALRWASQLSWSSSQAYLIVLGSMEPHPGRRYFDHVACVNQNTDWSEVLNGVLRSNICVKDVHFGHRRYPHIPGTARLPSYWERQRAKHHGFLQYDGEKSQAMELIQDVVRRWRSQVRPVLSRKLELPLMEPWPR